MRRRGAGHISPAHNEKIDFYGTFSFKVEWELAQLVAATGHSGS